MLEFKYIWGCGSTDWWVRDGFPKSSFDGNRRSWWQGWAWVMREKRVMRIYHINYGQQEWGLWTIKNMIRGHWSRQGSSGWLSFKSWYTQAEWQKTQGSEGLELKCVNRWHYQWWIIKARMQAMDGLSWWQGTGEKIWMAKIDDRENRRQSERWLIRYGWVWLMTGKSWGKGHRPSPSGGDQRSPRRALRWPTMNIFPYSTRRWRRW